jgi:hypothetical protein
MNDDWRLRIDLHEGGLAHGLIERLDASELEQELERSFSDRVVVSREGSEVFFYAGAREQADQAERLARSLASEHDWGLDCELQRWHPDSESWEPADKPLPASAGERAAEHAELIASERREDYPEFEVRVECASRQEAVELTAKLREEGLPVVHRFRFVVVGAPDEDTASVLAERIRAQAPPGSTVTAEGTPAAVLAKVGPNPFAIFGGMGG